MRLLAELLRDWMRSAEPELSINAASRQLGIRWNTLSSYLAGNLPPMSSTSGIRGRLLAGVLGVPELELYVVVTLQRRAIDEGLLLARVLERTPRGLLVEELSGSRQHALMGLPLALDVRVGDIVALSDAGIAWVAEDERDVIEQQRRRLAVAAAAKPETVPPRDDVTPITPAPTVGG